MGATNRSEEHEQARLIQWASRPAVRAIAPELAFLFHTPNGGKRDAFVGAQMTALGVKRGVPDLLLPLQRNGHTGLAIEFKSLTGTTTPHQDAFLSYLRSQGWHTAIARTAEQGQHILAQYVHEQLAGIVL